MTEREEKFLEAELEEFEFEEHCSLPTGKALDEDSRMIISFTDEASCEHLDMMKDHIEAFAEELGLEIHIEIE